MFLTNLTQEQKQILEHMWAKNTKEELFTWINNRPPRIKREAYTLYEMLILSAIDELPEEQLTTRNIRHRARLVQKYLK